MSAIRSSIACNLDVNILQTALPLFESERVQGLEWAFDTLFRHEALPDWFDALLKAYAQEGRLIGHGVFFSLFSGRWTAGQAQWLRQLKTLSATYAFDHITEHFGFMTGSDFHKGAPLGIPFTASTLALGIDRLKRIQQAANCPVGLENLAFAFSIDDIDRHGSFLNQLIEPINGFIILDLHNLYCQSHNFGVDPIELLSLYPLDRVREIHISGGSWAESEVEPGRRIRRDTHDGAVTTEVFTCLTTVLPECPNLKYVVLEQLGTGLTTEASRHAFQEDFFRMDQIVQAQNDSITPVTSNSFLPQTPLLVAEQPPEDILLQSQQDELSAILESVANYDQARTLLGVSNLANSAWEIDNWTPRMLETAIAIAQKWQHGFA